MSNMHENTTVTLVVQYVKILAIHVAVVANSQTIINKYG